MGVGASSSSPVETSPHAAAADKKRNKVGSLSTLRKRFQRRRRTSKGYHDHAQVFREMISDWSARDVLSLVEEWEQSGALKEVALEAEAARPPPPTTLTRDMGTLFETTHCSDINLIYQGTVFSVHRAILAARCPFFREMLSSLSSVCTEVAVDIDIAGVSVPLFGELLRYLYTGEMAHTHHDMHLLMQLSEQFGIPNPLEQDLKYLLETGIYSDVSLSFTGDGGVSRGCCEAGAGECRICHGPNEFWCHRAILSARSPFFRNVIHRQQQRGSEDNHRTRILLDDSVIPRRFACILLRAVYQDSLEFGGGGRGSVEEAMQLYEVARFIEMDALVQSCEEFVVGELSVECVLGVLEWGGQAHGSRWAYRQAVQWVREEFTHVAHSPALLHMEKEHLVDVLHSDFLQAGELEVLQAVLKWGEHQLFKRVEEREPNLVSHTAHSVSRRGIRRRDLSDAELRDLLSDLLPLVRVGHVLPPDSEVLAGCVRRGLVSTPPPHMLGDEGGGGAGKGAWVRGRGHGGLYVKPRLFTPFVEEAKAWLEEQLGQDTDVVRHQVWHISHIPDTLYMVHEKPPVLEPPHHLCPPSSHHSSSRDTTTLMLDEGTLRQLKKREKELRGGAAARRAYAVVRNHCDVTKLLQLRVVREFGLPDSAMELLHRTSYQVLHPPPPPSSSSHNQMSRSCCSDHLNEIIPDIAMATSLLEQMGVGEAPPSPPQDGGGGFSLRMF